LYASEYIYGSWSRKETVSGSVTRTLRLDEDVDAALKRMADESGESVNVIAGRALRRLVEWDGLAERAALVVISPITLGRLMDKQTLEEARSLGESVDSDVLMPFMTSISGEVTLTSALEVIKLISRYMARFQFHHVTSDSKNVITIRHSGGMKWSAFYMGVVESLFGKTLGLNTKSRMTEELVALEFDMPKSSRVD
jgi:predicted transcriptional regulator